MFRPYLAARPRFCTICVLFELLLFVPPAAWAQNAPTGELLTLDEALRIALQNNPGIQIVRNEAQIAANNYTRGNAGYLPTVGMSASQAYSNRSGLSGTAYEASYDVSAGASVTVFDGFSRAATYDRLEALRRQAGLQAQNYTEATVADLITLYFDLIRQQQQIEVLNQAVDISQERFRIADLRLGLGSASELEVRRARVDLNADQASLLRQEVNLANSKSTFNQLLGRETGLSFHVADSIVVNPALQYDELRAEAVRSNTALQVAQTSRSVAETVRREVRSQWYPRIDLSVGYVFNQLTDNIGLPISRPGGLTYGLSASFDIFEGFNRNRQLQNARLQIANSDLEIRETETQLQSGLQSAFASYQNSLQLVRLEEENQSLAEQNVQVALERFRLGTISSIELREVQIALTNARSRLITARFEAKQAEVRLLELSGRLKQLPGLD